LSHTHILCQNIYVWCRFSVLVTLTPKDRDSAIQASGNPLAVKIGLDTLGANYPGRRFSFFELFAGIEMATSLARVSSLQTHIM